MQRLWSVISTTFLIECHWFLLYWIEYYFPSNLTPSSSTLWHYHWDSATKLRNEFLGFIHIVFPFKVRAIMLLSTQLIQWDAVRWKIPAASSLLAGGKVANFEMTLPQKIALESKCLIHTWWTWCQITWKRIFYPIQQKSMAFNQECCWNYGSKSLHSFWATLYNLWAKDPSYRVQTWWYWSRV